MLFMFGDPLERNFVLKSRPVVVVVGGLTHLADRHGASSGDRQNVHMFLLVEANRCSWGVQQQQQLLRSSGLSRIVLTVVHVYIQRVWSA